MFLFDSVSETKRINQLIKEGAKSRLTDEQFIVKEIQRFLSSQRRKVMIQGKQYYNNKHDILYHKRTVIGENGELEEVHNLPNHKIIDNQYRKMVVQKKGYLLGQPISFKVENKNYGKHLKKIFNKKFQRLLKNVGEDSLNCGIGWLYIYYGLDGEIEFKRLLPYEVIPGWADSDHTKLDYAIRIYEIIAFEGKQEKVIQKVEVYDSTGIYRFILDGNKLLPDDIPYSAYLTLKSKKGNKQYNWMKIPLVPFKYNSEETPLITYIKSLQDGINTILSNFQNNMEEDARSSILVLVNYDGERLGEFRKNLATYGAVKVRSVDGTPGDLKTLQVDVNGDNYKIILDIFKKALIENAMGYDAKDDKLGSNANQLNIMSMYSDIDINANDMETEYQASFEELLWFINVHLFNIGLGDFENEEVTVIFNRDILISESEVIENCGKSAGILSDETIVENHPWVDDPQTELARIQKQKENDMDNYFNTDIIKNGDANEEE